MSAALELARERVAAAAKAARERWPGITIEESDLARLAAESVEADEPLPPHLEELALAAACLQGQPAALAHFERECLDGLRDAVRRLVTSDDQVDDLKQRLRERLLLGDPSAPPRLASYQGRGSLKAWVAIAGKREALMARRVEASLQGRAEQAAREVDPDAFADPELARMRSLYGPSFRAAFEKALRDLDARDRTVLRSYFVEQLSLEQLGSMLGVHRVTAWRHILAARERCLVAVRTELRASLHTTPSELDSLMAVMGEGFHITLSRLL